MEEKLSEKISRPNRHDIIVSNLGRWFYPTGEKFFREYQFNIIKTCLLDNTLVILPTGLGKTFIASCVMYNYFQWFSGKIFFLAPTKPLVNQQKDSFLILFPYLKDDVTEVNGLSSKEKRLHSYKSKRIFFITPQTLCNDLLNCLIDRFSITLIVFDEAHKAQGNYAYVNIVKIVSEPNSSGKYNKFRVVALSASPGTNIKAIQFVVQNLKIKKVELRTEKDGDVTKYIFEKKIDIIDIPIDNEILKYKKVVDLMIKERFEALKKVGVVPETFNYKLCSISKLREYQEMFRGEKEMWEFKIGKDMIRETFQTFNLIHQLILSKKMLLGEGIESFRLYLIKIEGKENSKFNKFINNTKNLLNIPMSAARTNLINSKEFKYLKHELFNKKDSGKEQSLISKFFPKTLKQKPTEKETDQNNQNSKATHPKLTKLVKLIEDRVLTSKNAKTMIFTQYKNSAEEIFQHLFKKLKKKDVNIAKFTGQDKNFSQKDQVAIIEKFKKGEISILISTSVAEEGIDIGDVDFIFCYDITSTSPIKLIQRFGRTGRSSNGNVIVLATKGEEKSKYYRALKKINNLTNELKKNIKERLEKSTLVFVKNNLNELCIPEEDIYTCERVESQHCFETDAEIANQVFGDCDSLDALSNFASSSSERDEEGDFNYNACNDEIIFERLNLLNNKKEDEKEEKISLGFGNLEVSKGPEKEVAVVNLNGDSNSKTPPHIHTRQMIKFKIAQSKNEDGKFQTSKKEVIHHENKSENYECAQSLTELLGGDKKLFKTLFTRDPSKKTTNHFQIEEDFLLRVSEFKKIKLKIKDIVNKVLNQSKISNTAETLSKLNLVNSEYSQRKPYEHNMIFHIQLKKALDFDAEVLDNPSDSESELLGKKRKISKVII